MLFVLDAIWYIITVYILRIFPYNLQSRPSADKTVAYVLYMTE